ncbi:M23 family metallopeptidase [Natranaerofaba carboxydovora]|uniref:M23 family metallopeptidase n=1 Tax=Natranaerofaba carboxydovora TaxID=2742683 RepID=UPI001F140D8D|nr:M23 family metallopeptidase [Natranaerofaba carboxydovora]UMZ72584.1 Peptidase family M23 [Natranaerofaba carboxydovora]
MTNKTKLILLLSVFAALILAWNVVIEDNYHLLISEEEDKEKEEKNIEKVDPVDKNDENEDGEKEDDEIEDELDNEEEKDTHKDEAKEDKADEKKEEKDQDVSSYDSKYEREELIEKLEHHESPVEGASITRRESQLPGAPREYRNGIHEGVDYYHGFVDVPIEMGTPVLASADGKVIRADHDYQELTKEEREEILNEARAAEITPEEILDKLRGKQVWIEHEDGIVTRYVHLDSIPEDIEEGVEVLQGEHIGGVGNSGTSHGAEGTNGGAHLHYEIWITDDYFLGKDMEPMEARNILVEIFQ